MRPEETVDYHLQHAWLNVSRMYNQLASEFGLTRAMGYVLMSIDDECGTFATRIGPMLGMEPTSLTRLLSRMEEKDLIVRKKDPDDGRVVMICLTKSGMEKRKLARSVVKRFNNQLLAAMSESEFATFKQVIGKVHIAVEEFRSISIK